MASRQKNKGLSNMQWFFLIAGIVIVDIIQIILDIAFQIGVIVNRVIDVGVAVSLFLIFQMSNTPLTIKHKISIFGTLIGEEIPNIDALPFWTLDVVYIYISTKTQIIEKVGAIAGVAGQVALTAVAPEAEAAALATKGAVAAEGASVAATETSSIAAAEGATTGVLGEVTTDDVLEMAEELNNGKQEGDDETEKTEEEVAEEEAEETQHILDLRGMK